MTLKLMPLGGVGETGALNCMLYETDQTAFLVDCGIDSISLSPDAVMQTRLIIAEHEKNRKK